MEQRLNDLVEMLETGKFIRLGIEIRNLITELENLQTAYVEKLEKIDELEDYILKSSLNEYDFDNFPNDRYDIKTCFYPFYSRREELIKMGITDEKQFAYIKRLEQEEEDKAKETVINEDNE